LANLGDALVGCALGTQHEYHILGLLGRGATGTVYRGEHVTSAWTVPRAIKVLNPDLTGSAEFVERFRREARIIAELEHPNILPVYDFGETDGLLYLVLRLVSDGSLHHWLGADAPPPWDIDRAQWLADQVLPALDAAHAHGVIHRDVKPQNILISRDPLWTFLSDFGIAKLLTETAGLTHTGSVLGTPSYMSPEQLLGQELDSRSDLYSFGVVLYEILTGSVPHTADTPLAVALKRVHEPAPAARSLNPALPASLEAVLARALARNPQDRYASGEELRKRSRELTLGKSFRPATLQVRSRQR
jgi:serine/threonine-protein kinase